MSAARLYSKKARTRALADTVEPVPARADSVTRVVAQFRVIFNAVKAHLQDVERRAGIGGAQVWALSCIRDQPGLGVNDLARALKVRQPTASSLSAAAMIFLVI